MATKKTTKNKTTKKKVSKPLRKEKTPEQKLEETKTIGIIIGIVGGFLLTHYVVKPIFTAFSMETAWWVYFIVILMAIGSVSGTLTKQLERETNILNKRGK